jgi:hypothetical protein
MIVNPPEAKCWFQEQIDEILSFAPKGFVELHLYVTAEPLGNVEKLDKSEASSETGLNSRIEL